MSLFGWLNDSDDVFDDDEDDIGNELDVPEEEIEEAVDQIKGKVNTGGEFFNCIGANPPGPECLSCNNRYPGCTDCPYGYVDNEKLISFLELGNNAGSFLFAKKTDSLIERR